MIDSLETGQPPMDDQWILAFDPSLRECVRTKPWVFATRGDHGYHDADGDPVDVQAWKRLPDPQPKPTGWTPPQGRLDVSRGKIVETGWEGWIVVFVRPDGTSYEERECMIFDDEVDADAAAAHYASTYGLTVEKDRTEMRGQRSNVLAFPISKERP